MWERLGKKAIPVNYVEALQGLGYYLANHGDFSVESQRIFDKYIDHTDRPPSPSKQAFLAHDTYSLFSCQLLT